MTWWKNEFYSQFGEDGVLFGYFRSREYSKTRNLSSIGNGFFVDIGAHHPYMISNTWFFYQSGWRGINVEPTPGAISEFEKIRPDDINLEMAIAQENGVSELISYGRDVKNTLQQESVDETRDYARITVKTRTLESLLDEFLPNSKDIDLLSVDVEGFDLVVLRSNNWSKYRPEIIVVEDHVRSIKDLMNGEIFQYMNSVDYELYSWVRPSLIFRRL